MKKWIGFILVALAMMVTASCIHTKNESGKKSQSETSSTGALKRYVAQTTEEEPAFWIQSYIGPNPLKKIWEGRYVTEKIGLAQWLKDKNGPSFRGEKLFQMYRANTRLVSNRGNTHVACFTGDPEVIRDRFFETSIGFSYYRPVGENPVTFSSDLRMIGIGFEALTAKPGKDGQGQKPGDRFHFRIADCVSSGKASILAPEELVENSKIEDNFAAVDRPNRRPSAVEDGFEIFDEVINAPKNLPRFKLKTDFEKIPKEDLETERPWKGMDISDPKEAERFALMLQKYVYEGMYDQTKNNSNQNFIAEKNKKRYWCHMPWLNVGNTGREAIHGLTMERDLSRNPMYPDIKPGSNWGVAYYNAQGCRTIQKVFFDDGDLRADPQFNEYKFDEGSLSVKILFTQANFPSIKDAYKWTANVSPPKSNTRSLQDVRHIQMDIGLKDPSLTGTHAGNEHWVMVTYYYERDPKYKNIGLTDSKSEFYLPSLPPGLARMRPQGVQVGFEEKDTILFSGAVTNSVTNDFKNPKPLKHLNGPADNARTNCFGCHGTAGTSVPMVPGVKTNAQYLKVKGSGLDFSQQLSLAKRNFETAPQSDGVSDSPAGSKGPPRKPE